MERLELVRRLVLNSICDDFENVDQTILPQAARADSRFGLAIKGCDVVDALRRLVEDGLAKRLLYPARARTRSPENCRPSLGVVEGDFQTYFYITKKGMDLHLSMRRGGRSMTKARRLDRCNGTVAFVAILISRPKVLSGIGTAG